MNKREKKMNKIDHLEEMMTGVMEIGIEVVIMDIKDLQVQEEVEDMLAIEVMDTKEITMEEEMVEIAITEAMITEIREEDEVLINMINYIYFQFKHN